jgi:hypothetical protein
MNTNLASLLSFLRGRRSLAISLTVSLVLGTALGLLAANALRASVAVRGAGDLPGKDRQHAGLSAAQASAKAPHPRAAAAGDAARRFITVNPGDTVDFGDRSVSLGTGAGLLHRIGLSGRYRAVSSGHAVVEVGRGRAKRQVYLFVSPVPSHHVTREDVDWYKTQYGTGIANCGPALVSMAILWARGKDIPVQQIRAEIGYPNDDGGTSFDDLGGSLGRHGVSYRSPTLSSPRDLVSILDHGHLAFVLIQSGDIQKVKGDPTANLVGRYYDDDEGHYVLVKGYSLDWNYFVVYDPYPVDWESNSLRYADEVTMIGKNRYYSAPQLFDALKTRMVIEVTPD